MRRPGIWLVLTTISILVLTGLGVAGARVDAPAEEPVLSASGLSTAGPTATLQPTAAATSASTATPVPLAIEPSPTPSYAIPTYPPNLQGDILVLVYHGIDRPEDRWARTPENLRADLETMLAQGYYPVNLIDVATGSLDHVPRGRRPIALTFDDSSAGQFRYLADGSVDPDCAVGILLAMHEQYGEDWPLRATFFVLLWNRDEPGPPLFRQPDLAVQKARALVEWGMEIGSHTITHPYLRHISAEQVQWELAVSQNRIEALIPGYRVRSLATPEGSLPDDPALLRAGYAAGSGLFYTYEAVALLRARPAASPFSPDFDPHAIPRVQATQSELDRWFSYYEQHPERYYVSAGEQPESPCHPWCRQI